MHRPLAILAAITALVVGAFGLGHTLSTNQDKGAWSGAREKNSVFRIDDYAALIEGGDQLRNPDGNPGMVFLNHSGAVDILISGAKLPSANARFEPQSGPIEIRASVDRGKDEILGFLPRDQIIFNMRVRVPAGTRENAVRVYFFNSDRANNIFLRWRVSVVQ